jgi:hypothetical protein
MWPSANASTWMHYLICMRALAVLCHGESGRLRCATCSAAVSQWFLADVARREPMKAGRDKNVGCIRNSDKQRLQLAGGPHRDDQGSSKADNGPA